MIYCNAFPLPTKVTSVICIVQINLFTLFNKPHFWLKTYPQILIKAISLLFEVDEIIINSRGNFIKLR